MRGLEVSRWLDAAREALERWDVLDAREVAEKARVVAAGAHDLEGCLLAEVLAERARVLTAAPGDEASDVVRAPPGKVESPELAAATRRLGVERGIAASGSRPPELPPLSVDSLLDDFAATALAAVQRLRDPALCPQRLVAASALDALPPRSGWEHLVRAVELEARGKSGAPALDDAIASAEARGARALLFAAFELRALIASRRGADRIARAVRDRMQAVLEDWLVALPEVEALAVRARAERAMKLFSEDGDVSREPNARLIDVALALASERRPEVLVDLALDSAISVTRAERGVLLLSEPHGGHRVAAKRYVDHLAEARGLLGLSSTVATQALSNREVVVSSDVQSDQRFSECASLNTGVTSVLCVPILARTELQGAIYLDRSRAVQAFSSDAIARATAVGNMLAATLFNARVVADLEARTRELEATRDRLDAALAARTVERDGMSRRLARVEGGAVGAAGLVGRGTSMMRLLRSIERIGPSDVPVLINGETGSGKELVARALHAASRRRDGPFVAINCGALSESLLEAELFGAERGAFTGATSARIGLFVAADGGTLLLDEVGDMPPAMQTALLRALETSEIRAVGATKSRRVDVRVLAATHRDLGELVRQGAFREDLRYRLEVVRLEVPPLRERSEDMPELCQHLLTEVSRRYAAPDCRLSQAALAQLVARRWPGNVRELRHVLAAAALSASDGLITPADLPEEMSPAKSSEPLDFGGSDGHAARIAALQNALRSTRGHRGRAAELLGISRATLYRYMEIYEIDPSEFEAPQYRGRTRDSGSGN
jgi:two-component system response regulator HydG